MRESNNIPEVFGSMVFNEAAMEQYVAAEAVAAWRQCLEQDQPLTLEVANEIAAGMKQWALEHGATHFTHWFQPLNGVTAEKHDSFISPVPGGKITMEFSGKSRTRPASPPAACAPPLRPEATAPGTRRPSRSSRTAVSASRRSSAPTAATRWTRKRRCCAPWRQSAARPYASCACSATSRPTA